MRPPVELKSLAPPSPDGWPQDGVLNRLKASAWIRTYWPCTVLKFLNPDMLMRSHPGPWIWFDLEPEYAIASLRSVSNVPRGMLLPGLGSIKAQGLYQLVRFLTVAGQALVSRLAAGIEPPPLNGLPTLIAFSWLKPSAPWKLPPPVITVNGMPVCAVQVRLVDQPPTR